MSSNIDFSPSSYAPFMQTAMVNIGNDIDLCVEVGGNPKHPAVLLIMGLGCQMLHWPNSFVEELINQGFYVIRYDNRDVGLSSKIKHKRSNNKKRKKQIINKPLLKLMTGSVLGRKTEAPFIPYSLEDMANDAYVLINKLQLQKVHVIGASMGGMIAQVLTAKHPEKIATLGLLFSSNKKAFLPPPYPKQLKSIMTRPKLRTEEGIIEHSAKVLRSIGSRRYFNVDETKKYSKITYNRSYYPLGYINHLLAIMSSGSLVKYNKKITTPTVIVHGAQDKLLPVQHGRSLAKTIKNAKFVEVTDLAHDIPQPLIKALVIHFSSHMKKA